MNRYAVALALVVLSGAAALGHQLLWVRLMVDVLGAGAGTFARVTGAFFLGLSLGAWVASRYLPKSGWRGVAVAELAVAALAGFNLWIAGQNWLTTLPGWAAPAAEWGLPFLLVLPPAVAMGLVLPWIVHAAGVNGRQSTWLYAVNTAGAVAGVVGLIGIGLPELGLRGAGLLAIGLNVLVAAACLLLSSRIWEEVTTKGPNDTKSQGMGDEASPLPYASPVSWEALLAFASGFLILGQEVVLQQQFAQVTINSLFSSATVLTLVLTILAVAAAAAPWFAARVGSEAGAISWALCLAAAGCAVQPFILTTMRGGLNYLPYQLTAGPYLVETAMLGFAVVTPLLLFAGLVFPTLLLGTRGNASSVGKLLAWNGLGGLLGAELSNLVIAPIFGLWQSMGIFACGYLALAAWRCPQWVGVSLAVAVALSVLAAARLPQVGVLPRERLVEVEVGREGVVAVVQRGDDDWRILFNNTYSLGGSKAQLNQERQALLPLILHGEPKSVATLGVATGSTLAGAALVPGVERIDAIELSPLAAEFAEKHFEPFNRNVFEDPRVRLQIGDARWVVARHPDSYDVVIGDLFLPWRTGEGRMFAREHFENVKRSLRDGGLFCQWLPLFQLTERQYEAILRTFRQVFPETLVVRGDFYFDQPIVGLIGGKEWQGPDWEKIAEACSQIREVPGISDPLMRHPEGIAMLTLGPASAPAPGPANSLANAWLEWNAGRNILGMREPWFVGEPFLRYATSLSKPSPDMMPSDLKEAQKAGLTLARDRSGDFMKLLPESILWDQGADWRQFPVTRAARGAK